MARRTTIWLTVLRVNDWRKPITVTGRTEGRHQRPQHYQLCKKLKPHESRSIIKELHHAESSDIPIRLDVIPQDHGNHTIMGLA